MWEAHVSLYVYGPCCSSSTFNEPVKVLPLYIGVRLQVLPLLRFHKTLCLLQCPFPYAPADLSFIGIIRDSLTTFNLLVSFFIFCLYRLLCFCFLFFVFFFVFFMALFVEWFWVRSADIILQWDAGDDAPSCMWGIPRFRDIPLGSTKVLGSGC